MDLKWQLLILGFLASNLGAKSDDFSTENTSNEDDYASIPHGGWTNQGGFNSAKLRQNPIQTHSFRYAHNVQHNQPTGHVVTYSRGNDDTSNEGFNVDDSSEGGSIVSSYQTSYRSPTRPHHHRSSVSFKAAGSHENGDGDTSNEGFTTDNSNEGAHQVSSILSSYQPSYRSPTTPHRGSVRFRAAGSHENDDSGEDDDNDSRRVVATTHSLPSWRSTAHHSRTQPHGHQHFRSNIGASTHSNQNRNRVSSVLSTNSNEDHSGEEGLVMTSIFSNNQAVIRDASSVHHQTGNQHHQSSGQHQQTPLVHHRLVHTGNAGSVESDGSFEVNYGRNDDSDEQKHTFTVARKSHPSPVLRTTHFSHSPISFTKPTLNEASDEAESVSSNEDQVYSFRSQVPVTYSVQVGRERDESSEFNDGHYTDGDDSQEVTHHFKVESAPWSQPAPSPKVETYSHRAEVKHHQPSLPDTLLYSTNLQYSGQTAPVPARKTTHSAHFSTAITRTTSDENSDEDDIYETSNEHHGSSFVGHAPITYSVQFGQRHDDFHETHDVDDSGEDDSLEEVHRVQVESVPLSLVKVEPALPVIKPSTPKVETYSHHTVVHKPNPEVHSTVLYSANVDYPGHSPQENPTEYVGFGLRPIPRPYAVSPIPIAENQHGYEYSSGLDKHEETPQVEPVEYTVKYGQNLDFSDESYGYDSPVSGGELVAEIPVLSAPLILTKPSTKPTEEPQPLIYTAEHKPAFKPYSYSIIVGNDMPDSVESHESEMDDSSEDGLAIAVNTNLISGNIVEHAAKGEVPLFHGAEEDTHYTAQKPTMKPFSYSVAYGQESHESLEAGDSVLVVPHRPVVKPIQYSVTYGGDGSHESVESVDDDGFVAVNVAHPVQVPRTEDNYEMHDGSPPSNLPVTYSIQYGQGSHESEEDGSSEVKLTHGDSAYQTRQHSTGYAYKPVTYSVNFQHDSGESDERIVQTNFMSQHDTIKPDEAFRTAQNEGPISHSSFRQTFTPVSYSVRLGQESEESNEEIDGSTFHVGKPAIHSHSHSFRTAQSPNIQSPAHQTIKPFTYSINVGQSSVESVEETERNVLSNVNIIPQAPAVRTTSNVHPATHSFGQTYDEPISYSVRYNDDSHESGESNNRGSFTALRTQTPSQLLRSAHNNHNNQPNSYSYQYKKTKPTSYSFQVDHTSQELSNEHEDDFHSVKVSAAPVLRSPFSHASHQIGHAHSSTHSIQGQAPSFRRMVKPHVSHSSDENDHSTHHFSVGSGHRANKTPLTQAITYSAQVNSYSGGSGESDEEIHRSGVHGGSVNAGIHYQIQTPTNWQSHFRQSVRHGHSDSNEDFDGDHSGENDNMKHYAPATTAFRSSVLPDRPLTQTHFSSSHDYTSHNIRRVHEADSEEDHDRFNHWENNNENQYEPRQALLNIGSHTPLSTNAHQSHSFRTVHHTNNQWSSTNHWDNDHDDEDHDRKYDHDDEDHDENDDFDHDEDDK